MEEEREEGEIVDVNDDDIYENIISSDEELGLRQRISELEAKNSELEKIASISKINDYDVACGTHYINLVDDDDGGDHDNESYYRQPSKYDYSSYTQRKSRSRGRKKKCRHLCRKYKSSKEPSRKSVRRKKVQPSKPIHSSESSSDDEFQLDRNELKAALKRNTSPNRSSTLKKKLNGIRKNVADFIKSKDEVVEDDISTSIEIMHLLNTINVEGIAPKTIIEDDESESTLDEQELRLIALKSAIVKKAEARKKRRIIETRPYSPTDTDIVMENVMDSKPRLTAKPKDELDNMEISPAASPNIQDGSLQPIDMELESDDENQKPPLQMTTDDHQIKRKSPTSMSEETPNITSKDSQAPITVPDESSLSIARVPGEHNENSLQQKQQDEDEEQALRASLLANMKRRVPANNSTPPEIPVPLEKPFNDVSMEADHLRRLLLSSVQKRRNSSRQILPNPFAIANQKIPAQLPKQKHNRINLDDVGAETPHSGPTYPLSQVPKSMEISMPQITSNLKEALKRIKEKGKQNVDPDAIVNDRVIKVDYAKVNRHIKSASDMIKSKQIQTNSALDDIEMQLQILVDNIDPKCTVKMNEATVSLNGAPAIVKEVVNKNAPKCAVRTNEATISLNSAPAIVNEVVNDNAPKCTEPAVSLNSVPVNVKEVTNNNHPECAVKMNKATVSCNSVPAIVKEVTNTNQLMKKTVELNSSKTLVNANDIVKETVELSSKTNVLLKNVKFNGSMVIECKTKDPTIIPLVISNKNETTLVEKNDVTLRPIKVIAQTKFIPESQISNLNQKENQQLSKSITIPKRSAEEKILTIAKKAKVTTMAKASKVITTLVEKPVKKMIIQLNNSDSESDDLILLNRHNELITNEKSYSGVASPVSFSFAPSSPMNTIETKSNDHIQQPTTDIFLQNLDKYLKSARSKAEQAKLEVEKKLIPKSPSLVSHLPPSSQLEYRNLLKRMALLEKRRSYNIDKIKTAGQKPKSGKNVTVTITNDLCINHSKSNDHVVQIVNVSSVEKKSEILKHPGIISPKQKFGAKQSTTKPNITSETTPNTTPKIEAEVISETQPNIAPETVLVSADIKNNKSNVPDVPELCVTPKSEVVITCNSSDVSKTTSQSTHDLQNFSALSQADKVKLMQNTELEYMRHSSSYLTDINKMSSLVCEARVQTEKKFHLESELEEMKLKVQQLEQELVKQKTCVSKLYPVISASHKNIMKKRSKSLQLHKKCYLIGKKIAGNDYKIADDPKAIIAAKIQSLSSETKLLKNMEKPAHNIVATSNVPSINIDKTPLSSSSLKTSIVTVAEKTSSSTPPINVDKKSSSNDENHSTAIDAETTTESNINSSSSHKPVGIPQAVSTIDCILPDIPKELSKMTIYKSPLDHMKNITTTDPDLIVCPFQLLGQCEDSECIYQHLSHHNSPR